MADRYKENPRNIWPVIEIEEIERSGVGLLSCKILTKTKVGSEVGKNTDL